MYTYIIDIDNQSDVKCFDYTNYAQINIRIALWENMGQCDKRNAHRIMEI